MDYPAGISTFMVQGRLVFGVADTLDAGQEPNLEPIYDARVIFTPDLDPTVYRISGSGDGGAVVYQEPIVAVTNADGQICVADGTPGVKLVYPLDTGISPSGWT